MPTLERDAIELSTAAPSPRAPGAWWRPEIGVFLVLWLGLLIAGRWRLLQDPGTFWHTVVGRQMLADGALVRSDAFTFTFAGRPWIAHQWLGECMMAGLHKLGGWDALLLATATLLAAFYTWIAMRLLRSGFALISVAVLLVVVLGASSHHFHIRPHLASLVLTGLSFALLCDVEAGRRSLRQLAWLIPLFLLWTNLHGGALGGLTTLTLCSGGWLIAWWLGGVSPVKTGRQAGQLIAVWCASLAAVLVNPYGLEMPAAWLTIMRLSLPDIIREHGRLDFRQFEAWLVIVLGVGYLATLWSTIDRRPGGMRAMIGQLRVTWLLPLVWLMLATDRVRHAPLFAIVAVIALTDLLPRSRWWQYLVENEWCFPPRGHLTRRAWLAVPIGLVLSVSFPLLGAGWARFDPAVWPVELVDDLKRLEAQPADADRRIFNSLELGGFLTFYTPRLTTFIDDRCELFGDEFLRAYSHAENHDPQQLDAWQRRYGFRHALVRAGSPFDVHLQQHADWRLERRDQAAALYRHE